MQVAKTYEGYTPFPHQRAVHKLLDDARKTGRMVIVKSRRQVGKSAMVEQELLRYAITYSRTVSGCVSPTLGQARKIFQDIVDGTEGSGLIAKSNETLLEMKLKNGSKIFFKSAEQREALRGYTISGILCIDEAAFIPDDIFDTISPWTNVYKAPMLVTSTPKLKTGWYFRYWAAGLTGSNPNIISVDFNDFDTSYLLGADKLEEYRRMMPRNQFLTEYMGEFLDDEGVVFSHFRECTMAYGEIPEYRQLYVGIDWANGGGNDDTVICCLNEKGEQVYLDYFNDLSPTEQIRKISGYFEEHRAFIKLCIPELNSLGTPMTDMLKEELRKHKIRGIKIDGRATTNKSKVDMVADLQVAFEQHRISLLDDEKQKRELSIYSAEYNPKTNKVTYNAPAGSNDDCCIALMYAYQAYLEKGRIGDYMISII